MDSRKKPENSNPREGANLLSQLLFVWLLPFLWKGTKDGLTTDDLTKCLKKDESEKLGDNLEREWEKEVQRAAEKHRKPKLKWAMLRTYYRQCVIDGFLVFLFVLFKSLAPFVLGQLLVQFQQSTNLPREAINTNFTNSELHLLNRTARAFFENEDPESDIIREFQSNIVKSFGKYSFFTDSSSNSGGTNSLDEKLEKKVIQNFTAGNSSHLNGQSVSFNQLHNSLWNDIYFLSMGVILTTLIPCFIIHHTDLRQRMLGARMRIACCSLIYRKTLHLSKKAAGQTPAGYLVNLLSNDVGRLDFGLVFVHYIWLFPLQAVLICYLIWREIGIAALVGVIGLLLQTIPVQTTLSRLSAKLRMKVALRTDQRVGIMNEIIQGIQVIKMYAWEKPFHAVVAESRRKEVKQIRYSSYIKGINLSAMVFTERSTLFLTLMTCVFLSQAITADIVFSMAQYFNVFQLVAAIFYPLALSFGAEALVSISRIEDYLMQEDQDETLQGLRQNESIAAGPNETVLLLKDLSATWEDQKLKTLSNINLNVKCGQLCAIIGPVGAGKSSLLQLILGELPIYSGNVEITGTLSYASQEPWLFTGTVRSNILFGLKYDRMRYQDVVKHCALLTDFAQLPDGDKTLVGERGSSLSGGQKARISLARAVYKSATIYLFDDPLSAVDAHVGRHLFDEVIGPNGYLAANGKTRLLVTHQVHFLKEADWIIFLDKGEILRQGKYNALANSDLDFAKVLEHSSDTDSDIIKDNISDDYDDIPYIDGIVNFQKGKSISIDGSMKSSISKSVSMDDDIGKEIQEDQASGNISFRVWKKYFSAGGNIVLLTFSLFILIFSQFVTSGSDLFVNFWTQQEFLRQHNKPTVLTTFQCLYIYGSLIIGVILITLLRGYMFFNICMRASKNLHNKMFAKILGATMRFFDTNPSGRILNRFSRDMGAIDELLPKAIIDSIQVMLVMVGILVVISIVNPILLLALAVAVILFTCVLKLYLKPAQDLKRLEGICRSPIFSHLSASLSGLTTIRVNNSQNRLILEFDCLQDVHTAAWQLTISSNTALGLWLDCISIAFIAAVTFSFIAVYQKTFSGNVGLAISQSLVLTGMVQYGVRQAAESIQQMTSVERVLEYTDLEQESSPSNKAPEKWPSKGRIQFNNMSFRYSLTEAPVLKHLQLDIHPGWKVGIVGRTGAGKSSLIGALFRLSFIEGEILIDGINTAHVPLETLRSSVSIIPQNPVLFSATIRYNLDPFNAFDDASLFRVLEEVELKHEVETLDYMVTESGSNFSVGQRQLICLGRAILRNNKILVLDEATANVDPQTDAVIQKTIREKFKHCTVLTVAHRLHTVMDSDRILVMEAGFAKEFDIPHVLLKKKDGILRDMVEATGPQESESLKRIANDSFNEMMEQ